MKLPTIPTPAQLEVLRDAMKDRSYSASPTADKPIGRLRRLPNSSTLRVLIQNGWVEQAEDTRDPEDRERLRSLQSYLIQDASVQLELRLWEKALADLKSASEIKSALLRTNFWITLAGREFVGALACHHIDGNPLNNSPENLRIVTLTENAR